MRLSPISNFRAFSPGHVGQELILQPFSEHPEALLFIYSGTIGTSRHATNVTAHCDSFNTLNAKGKDSVSELYDNPFDVGLALFS